MENTNRNKKLIIVLGIIIVGVVITACAIFIANNSNNKNLTGTTARDITVSPDIELTSATTATTSDGKTLDAGDMLSVSLVKIVEGVAEQNGLVAEADTTDIQSLTASATEDSQNNIVIDNENGNNPINVVGNWHEFHKIFISDIINSIPAQIENNNSITIGTDVIIDYINELNISGLKINIKVQDVEREDGSTVQAAVITLNLGVSSTVTLVPTDTNFKSWTYNGHELTTTDEEVNIYQANTLSANY